MPYFANNNINLLFIHIPKTGGTSLEVYFSSKFNIELNNKSLFSFLEEENKKDILITTSLQHITYKDMIKYNNFFNINFNNLKIITIVRNPYERIISDLLWYKLININTSKEEVYNIIQEYIYSDQYDNHNLPQYLFLIDNNNTIIKNINILRTETLNDDMKTLGYIDFNIHLCKNNNEINYYNYLNNKTIEIINNFYHLDFIKFKYTKIDVLI